MNGYDFTEITMGLFTWLFAVPVYIIFLYMIARYRNLPPFNIPFYGLVFQCGLLDLWCVMHQYLLFNQFLLNLAPHMFLWARLVMATVSFSGYFYIRACQGMAVLMISINRFTALVMPLRHDLIWTRKLTWMAIISQHMVAAMIITPALVSRCFRDFVLTTNETKYTFDNTSNYCAPRIGAPSAFLLTILSIVLILLYFKMFLKVPNSVVPVGQENLRNSPDNRERKSRSSAVVHGIQTENERNIQRSLAIGGAIISLTLVLNTILFLVTMVLVIRYSYPPPIVAAFKLIIDTLFCIINPFVLLCFGTKIRPYYLKCVKHIFCIKENQQNNLMKDQKLNQRISFSPKVIPKHDNAVIELNL